MPQCNVKPLVVLVFSHQAAGFADPSCISIRNFSKITQYATLIIFIMWIPWFWRLQN